MDIDRGLNYAIVTGPSARQRIEAAELSDIAIYTTLGARYVMPDMTPMHFRELMMQVDDKPVNLVVRNISEASLIIPFRILREIALVDRHNLVTQTLWEKQNGEA